MFLIQINLYYLRLFKTKLFIFFTTFGFFPVGAEGIEEVPELTEAEEKRRKEAIASLFHVRSNPRI